MTTRPSLLSVEAARIADQKRIEELTEKSGVAVMQGRIALATCSGDECLDLRENAERID